MSKRDSHISDYRFWIEDVKSKIQRARSKVALSVNSQLIELYWELGKEITEKIDNSDWGTKMIEQVSVDLKHEFPDMKGFSQRNLYSIRQWFKFYNAEFEFVPQAVAQLPWGHNRLLISKTKDIKEALFYCDQAIINGWSRDTLEIKIENNLIQRQGSSTHNFLETLPAGHSKMAAQTFRDPYNFDFLGLEDEALEREIERGLTEHITDFLIELGKGFAYVGRQYKLEVGENDYFVDILFYHLDLRCYVVIELKAGKFKPEYAGKLNFYLSAMDTQVKRPEDNPTIGILLCKKKDKIEAEYALRDIGKPMGISEYKLTEAIPDKLRTKLPSIEELEIDLQKELDRKKH